MNFTRRSFLQGGISAFTVGFGAPAFISDLARAQGASRRNLVVLYLSGGNDAIRSRSRCSSYFARSSSTTAFCSSTSAASPDSPRRWLPRPWSRT
jgi:uncharacterized protein (DUF1501 family)